jgi:hypothetical protein
MPSGPGTTRLSFTMRTPDGREVHSGDVIGRYRRLPNGGCDTEGQDMGVMMESNGEPPSGGKVHTSTDADCVVTVHVDSEVPPDVSARSGHSVAPIQIGLSPADCPRISTPDYTARNRAATPESARDQAAAATGLPDGEWNVEQRYEHIIDYRLTAGGRVAAAIVVDTDPGDQTGWTATSVQRCEY